MTGEKNNLSAVLERGRLAFRLAVVTLILSGALSLTVFLAGPVYQWSGMGLFTLGLLPFLLAVIFSAAAIVQTMLFSKSVSEEEEKQLLEKRKSSVNSLLDIAEDVRFTAKRTLANYEKYVPASIAMLCFILTAVGIVVFWNNSLLGAADTAALGSTIPKSPINLAFLCAIIAAFSFICGIFVTGQSHVREFRVLRPVGAWLILGAAVMIVCAVLALFLANGKEVYETFFERIVFLIYAILSIEFLLAFIIEFYRPRTQNEQRPVYESRLLSVFTEPGGVMRNIADSLDYQFGFKVSKTWIYSFFQKYLIPGLTVWVFFFWLFTGIAEIKPGEVGIRERFGAFVGDGTQVLQPGVHLKLPWPFETIVRVPVNIIQTITIGSAIDTTKNPEAAKVILWTGQHYLKEDTFLVATKLPEGKDSASSYQASILEVSLPLYYKAKADQPYRFAFNYKDVSAALLSIGQSEATRYFASTDFLEDLSYGRQKVSETLRERIQGQCDKLSMGVDVLAINMHDAHPPVGKAKEDGSPDNDPNAMPNVAEAFQNEVCAQEEVLSVIAQANKFLYETEADAAIGAMTILADANAAQFSTIQVAEADAFRFQQQKKAFDGMPSMFMLRTYLDFLENDCAALRKFVVSTKIPVRNYVLNMEEKPSLDLLDTDLSALGK